MKFDVLIPDVEIDAVVLDYCNSSANAMELQQSCTKPAKCLWPGAIVSVWYDVCYIDASPQSFSRHLAARVRNTVTQGYLHWGRNLTRWSLVNFKIIIVSVLQQLARQAPSAQDAGGVCLAGYKVSFYILPII